MLGSVQLPCALSFPSKIGDAGADAMLGSLPFFLSKQPPAAGLEMLLAGAGPGVYPVLLAVLQPCSCSRLPGLGAGGRGRGHVPCPPPPRQGASLLPPPRAVAVSGVLHPYCWCMPPTQHPVILNF